MRKLCVLLFVLLVVLMLCSVVYGQTTVNRPPLTITDSATTSPLKITARSAAPTSPATNDIYLDNGTNTTSGKLGFRYYSGSWADLGQGYDSDLAIWDDITPHASWRDILDGTTTTISNLRTIATLLGHPYLNAKIDYGATGDGATDDTAAIQAAIDAAELAGGGTVFLPVGTYFLKDALVFNATYAYGGATNSSVRLLGASSDGTVLRRDPVDVNEFCIEVTGGVGWEHALWVIENIMFDGGSGRDTGGIYVHNDNRVGLHVRNCSFWRCDIGFKTVGSLDWRLESSTFNRGNIGIWLAPSASQHGGCGLIDGRCNVSYNTIAGLFIDGTNTTKMEQVSIRDITFQTNYGFGMFVKQWEGDWPLQIEHGYFETNGYNDGTSVTLDGTAYDDQGNFHIEDSWNIIFKDCKLTRGVTNDGECQLSNSAISLINCQRSLGYGDVNYVGDSVIYHRAAQLAGIKVYDGNEIMVEGFETDTSLIYTVDKPTARCELRPFQMAYDSTNLWANGSFQTTFTPAADGGLTYSFVSGDAPEWGGYMSVRIPQCTGATPWTSGMRLWDNFTEVENGIYVWSFDVTSDVNDAELKILSSGGSGSLINCQTPTGLKCRPGEWRRYYGIGRSNYTQSAGDLYIFQTASATAETFNISNFQLVKVATYNDAVRYIREGRYPGMAGLPVMPNGLTIKNGSTSSGYIDMYADSDIDTTAFVRSAIAVIDVNNAEIKALTTPIELVAAPGSGKLIVVDDVSLFLDYSGGALAEASAPDDMAIKYDGGTGAQIATWDSTGFITGTADGFVTIVPTSLGDGAAAVTTAANVNKNVVLINIGNNYTGAGSTSEIRVIVKYHVLSGLGL